ncbi:MAG: class I SAM-dependent methyltransferase [Elusimicrobiaceae bacterium]|nr:class I SAM-dependent methyltransferase [Elusimicrobiaceae bacterium]
MPHKKLVSFAKTLGLKLTDAQADRLLAYARCVWEKKDFLNLTSAQSLEEILLRHICDGMVAAAWIAKKHPEALQVADAGAGCGYIGMTLAVCLPQVQVTLIESLERRCKFMNWAAMQSNIGNVQIKNVRLGQGTHFQFDVLTERAMGPLVQIGPLCLSALKPGGIFLAFQGEQAPSWGKGTVEEYTLPWDDKTRHLVSYKKDENGTRI